MYLENISTIPRSIDEVYKFMRDDLPKLAPFLPLVQKIERVDYRRVSENRVEILNRWFGHMDFPAILKTIVKPHYLHWKDNATWFDDKTTVEFRMEHLQGQTMFDLKGGMIFKSIAPDKTELKIRGDLVLYYDRIPGVPRLLAGKVKKMLDDFVQNKVGPGMGLLAAGVTKYFQAQGRA